MGKLDNYTSKAPDIVGSTTINHAARVLMGINCSEYVMLDHIARTDAKGKQADTLSVYIATGFTESEAKRVFDSLVLKGFLHLVGEDFMLTDKWESAFPDLNKEFDQFFWFENLKPAWTGTKKKALEYYAKLRKSYSRDFLHTQRNNYFEFLKLQAQLKKFDQQRMMAQVFLNPSNERYMEDYADYIVQLKAKYGDPNEVKPSPISRDDVMKEYGKDNNK